MSSKSLTSYLYDYEELIDANGCLEISNVPRSTLQNSIHSIFSPSRWMTGYGQPSSSVYDRMKLALRLATLMITEDCTLPWFTHLRFGREQKQRDRNSGSTGVYLAPTAREHKASSLETVKGDIEQLSRILTFQFVPPDCSTIPPFDKAWGTTQTIHNTPWDRKFSRSDYPYIDPKYTSQSGPYRNCKVPCITLSHEFAVMFSTSKWEKATTCQRYRVLFLFAVTLVHEIAHAYNWWFGDPSVKEPMWSQFDERDGELGFAWEVVTIGKIIEPFNNSILGAPCLMSSETHSWTSCPGEDKFSREEDRHARLEKLMDARDVEFHRIRVGPYRDDPYWRPEKSLRSNQWFAEDGIPAHKNVLVVLNIIPMAWIISWFQEEHWDSKRKLWRREGRYRPASLGPTFVLIYERSARGTAALHYATRADVDMYLDDVENVTRRTNLYDGNTSFEFAEGGRDYDPDDWTR